GSANGANSVYASDLDGDGDADVLSASYSDDKIAWYENLGGGVFGLQQAISTSADGATSVYATDLDGDVDVLSASEGDDKIAWYENRTFVDCNGNGVNDSVELSSGTSLDCNGNGTLDECDISSGSASDVNGNGVPDSCEPIGARYCAATANSSGLPGQLTILGSPLISQNDVMLTADQLPLQSFGFFITSRTSASVNPVPGSQGTLCVTGSIGRFVGAGQIVDSGSTGAVALSIDLSALPSPTGFVAAASFSTWYFQLWHRDANPALTSNFTDAVAVTFL
ncbi:MAG: VCBS repeat-containing protein, partial [Planctomycetota bacterium]|nr:VCBS repeat-containing protein [Planctomycetota bacterium]